MTEPMSLALLTEMRYEMERKLVALDGETEPNLEAAYDEIHSLMINKVDAYVKVIEGFELRIKELKDDADRLYAASKSWQHAVDGLFFRVANSMDKLGAEELPGHNWKFQFKRSKITDVDPNTIDPKYCDYTLKMSGEHYEFLLQVAKYCDLQLPQQIKDKYKVSLASIVKDSLKESKPRKPEIKALLTDGFVINGARLILNRSLHTAANKKSRTK